MYIVRIRTGTRKIVATMLSISGFLNLGFIIVMIASLKFYKKNSLSPGEIYKFFKKTVFSKIILYRNIKIYSQVSRLLEKYKY